MFALLQGSAWLARRVARDYPELLLPVLVWDLESLAERASEVLASGDERLDEPAAPEDCQRLERYSRELRIAIENCDQGQAIQAGANLADLLRLKLRPWRATLSGPPEPVEDDLFQDLDEGIFTDIHLKDEE